MPEVKVAMSLTLGAGVHDLIAKLQAERSQRTQINADSVLERVNTVADRCMVATEVRDRSGEIMDGETVLVGATDFGLTVNDKPILAAAE